MYDSPLDTHVSSPREIAERIAAEKRGLPFLVWRDGEGRQAIAELPPVSAKLVIGRRAESDIALPWDSEVSRVHAELERLGAEWLLADDGLSHNGTWVNSERVTTRRRLRDGDVVRVGATSLVFREPSEGSVTSPTVTAGRAAISVALTPAQRRVLVALCRPFRDSAHTTPATNQAIADELFVSVDTVKSTLRTLFDAFGLGDLPQNSKRQALAVRALQSGTVTVRELQS